MRARSVFASRELVASSKTRIAGSARNCPVTSTGLAEAPTSAMTLASRRTRMMVASSVLLMGGCPFDTHVVLNALPRFVGVITGDWR